MAGRLAIDDQEIVEDDAGDLERIWLGLRTADGLSLAGADLRQTGMARSWVAADLATIGANVVRLTPGGWLLLDQLALDLHQALGGRVREISIDAGAALVQIAGNSTGSGR